MLYAVLISFDKLLPFALFGLFAVGAFWLLEILAGRSSRADERLEELRNPKSIQRRDGPAQNKKEDAMAKVLEKASPMLSAPLKPKSEVETSKLKQKLSAAGFRGDAATSIFLGSKFIGLIVGLFFAGGTIIAIYGTSQNSMMYVVVAA